MVAEAATPRVSPSMRRRPFYLSAPRDVVALEAQAESLLDSAGDRHVSDLLGQPGALDPGIATMLLYRACYRGSNGAFLKALAAQPTVDAPLDRPASFIVIPGLNFRRHPETGADGRLVIDIAGRIGADVEVLLPEPRGSAGENGAMLARQLSGRDRQATWVISISKGTADFRVALRHLGGWPDWLSGWVNFSGVFQGTPIADKLTQKNLPNLMMRALIAAGGLVSRNIAEMRTDSALWRSPVVPPSNGRLIHVVGFPPPWSVEMRIAHHYKWLMQLHGPNDGLIPLLETFDYPGRVLPVWGADHFMRTPDVARLIYRLAHHLGSHSQDDE